MLRSSDHRLQTWDHPAGRRTESVAPGCEPVSAREPLNVTP